MQSRLTNYTLAVLLAILMLVAIIIGLQSRLTQANNAVDVSWPNCDASPPTDYAGVIIGVTGGLDFQPNPCLYDEARWSPKLALYTNTGYAGIADARHFLNFPKRCSYNNQVCLAYNYGFNSGKYAVIYADESGVHSSLWWLDVETDNSWSANYLYNRADLQGTLDAIKQYTFMSTVGVYSNQYQWDAITNGWLNYLPNWVPTGGVSDSAAKDYCQGKSFNGGVTWMTQYVNGLDDDYLCNSSFLSTLSR